MVGNGVVVLTIDVILAHVLLMTSVVAEVCMVALIVWSGHVLLVLLLLVLHGYVLSHFRVIHAHWEEDRVRILQLNRWRGGRVVDLMVTQPRLQVGNMIVQLIVVLLQRSEVFLKNLVVLDLLLQLEDVGLLTLTECTLLHVLARLQ